MTAILKPGEYDFHCDVHPFMSGQIIISTIAKEQLEQPSSSSSSITESETQVLL
jgi:hypothetical protein